MKKSAFISDVFFSFFICFLFSICLFRYLSINLWLSLLLALLCGVLAATSVAAFLQNKRKCFFLKKSDEAQKEKFLLHLALLSEEKQTELFEKTLTSEQPLQRLGKLRLFSKEEYYFLNFKFTPVNGDEIAKYARLKTGKKKILFCSKIEESALLLCEKLGIEVKRGEDVYLLVKERGNLPQHFLGEEQSENRRKRKLRLWFSKRNCKPFLIGGAMLLFTSFLTPFPYYYLLFGGVMLSAAALIKIFGYE